MGVYDGRFGARRGAPWSGRIVTGLRPSFMSLLQKIIDRISVEARQKGVKCRGTGNVLITEHNEQYIDAKVECGGLFIVNLRRDPESLSYACECKTYTQEREPCEHV